MKNAVNAEDKAVREAQAAAYKSANWARVIRMTARGGGKAVMVRRGA